jgi:hypothetical protein
VPAGRCDASRAQQDEERPPGWITHSSVEGIALKERRARALIHVD